MSLKDSYLSEDGSEMDGDLDREYIEDVAGTDREEDVLAGTDMDKTLESSISEKSEFESEESNKESFLTELLNSDSSQDPTTNPTWDPTDDILDDIVVDDVMFEDDFLLIGDIFVTDVIVTFRLASYYLGCCADKLCYFHW